MESRTNLCERPIDLLRRGIGALAILSLCAITVEGRPEKIDVLRIGTSGTLEPEGGDANDKSSIETLKSFIKDETGFNSEIIRQKNWQELAQKMSNGELQVGVFQGFEFAWAKEKFSDLKPLAVAVNTYVYPEVYLVAARDSGASDFNGFHGKSLSVVKNAPGFIRFFVDRQCQSAGNTSVKFFSKILPHENFEDAIDDVVDAQADVVAADRAALDAYKRRKPGRFAKLKSIVQSKPFLPAVVACYEKMLDDETARQFRGGLLGASSKEKGQTMLNLFRLTGFKDPDDKFDQVLKATREAYPAAGGDRSK
jgi:ABC-type phosphate/phosphonate transport system substrate-binding protein